MAIKSKPPLGILWGLLVTSSIHSQVVSTLTGMCYLPMLHSPRCCQSCWHWGCCRIASRRVFFLYIFLIGDPLMSDSGLGSRWRGGWDRCLWQTFLIDSHNLAKALTWTQLSSNWVMWQSLTFGWFLSQEASWSLCLIKPPMCLASCT